MKTSKIRQHAPWLKALGFSVSLHVACVCAAVLYSAFFPKPAPRTVENFFVLHDAAAANTAALADPDTQPLGTSEIAAGEEASATALAKAEKQTAADAPLLSDMPSFTITAAGDIIADTVVNTTITAIPDKAPSNIENPEMSTYLTVFTQTLRDAYKIPGNLGERRDLAVRIRYEVAADGTIGAVTILQTSGSAIFDASVVAAFRAMRNIGPRPDKRSSALVADFRI